MTKEIEGVRIFGVDSEKAQANVKANIIQTLQFKDSLILVDLDSTVYSLPIPEDHTPSKDKLKQKEKVKEKELPLPTNLNTTKLGRILSLIEEKDHLIKSWIIERPEDSFPPTTTKSLSQEGISSNPRKRKMDENGNENENESENNNTEKNGTEKPKGRGRRKKIETIETIQLRYPTSFDTIDQSTKEKTTTTTEKPKRGKRNTQTQESTIPNRPVGIVEVPPLQKNVELPSHVFVSYSSINPPRIHGIRGPRLHTQILNVHSFPNMNILWSMELGDSGILDVTSERGGCAAIYLDDGFSQKRRKNPFSFQFTLRDQVKRFLPFMCDHQKKKKKKKKKKSTLR
eukprot:TRINITY_DN6746_c0_g2_i1.p1 TRINITY_DN6746_c0_g2~~TRINITY_DN6746_c0_g2_i1.p1  ORF type:complete len:343 (+),score=90.27 TRINITY_DN6746_c0_g2_i1:190-1218(+)